MAVMLACAACGPSSDVDAQSGPASTGGGADTNPLDQMAGVESLGWLTTLNDLYPDEYSRLGAVVDHEVGSGSDVVAARTTLMEAFLPFMAKRKRSLRSAADELLVDYLRLNLAALEHLKTENPQACVEIAQGKLDPSTQLSQTAWTKTSEATAQLLKAAHGAEASPVARPDPTLTAEEQHKWFVEIGNAGATRRTAELLRDPAAAARASADELCQVRILLMKGALLSPPETAAKIVLAAG